MRLACQICPTADISVMPLLAADARAADGMVRAGLEGSEQLITVMFVDLRGATILGEAKLPYDLLYILNQFFDEMIKASVLRRDDQSAHCHQRSLFAIHRRWADGALRSQRQKPRDRRRRRLAWSAR